MKLNWGHKLVIGMSAFILFIVIMVFRMFSNSDGLEEKGYYEKGNQYQGRIDEMKNVEAFRDSVLLSFSDGILQLKFTAGAPDSAVFRALKPDARSKDFKITGIHDTEYPVDFRDRSKGKWNVQTEWYRKGKGFYHAETLFVP